MQNIIKSELGGLELPAFTLFPNNVPYTDTDLHPLLAYDPEKVKRLLDDAGWELAPGQTVRSKNGVPLVSAALIMCCSLLASKTTSFRTCRIALGYAMSSTLYVRE